MGKGLCPRSPVVVRKNGARDYSTNVLSETPKAKLSIYGCLLLGSLYPRRGAVATVKLLQTQRLVWVSKSCNEFSSGLLLAVLNFTCFTLLPTTHQLRRRYLSSTRLFKKLMRPKQNTILPSSGLKASTFCAKRHKRPGKSLKSRRAARESGHQGARSPRL